MESKKIVSNQKGFTLIEVIAVLVIIAILAAVAVPKYMKSIETARHNSARNAVNELLGRCNQVYADCLLNNNGQTTACTASALVNDTRLKAPIPDMGGFDVTIAAADPHINITVSGVEGVAIAPAETGQWTEPHN